MSADSEGGAIALRLRFYDILHNFVAIVLSGAFPLAGEGLTLTIQSSDTVAAVV